MTDEQWSTLTAWLKVPAAARVPIENELDLYSRVAAAGTGPRPSEVRSKLEHAAKLASELLEAIEELGPEEHDALCASQPVTVGPETNGDGLARAQRVVLLWTKLLDGLKQFARQLSCVF